MAKKKRTKVSDYTKLLYRIVCSKCGYENDCHCRFIALLPHIGNGKRIHEWEADKK